MDLSGAKIKPAAGMLAVRFVDDDDDDDEKDGRGSSLSSTADGSTPYEGCLAIVVGVGENVKGIKAGNMVVTRPYARDGLKVGDGIVLIDGYNVAATITA